MRGQKDTLLVVDDLLWLVTLIFTFSLLFRRCHCLFRGAAAYMGGATAYQWNSENKTRAGGEAGAEAGTELDNKDFKFHQMNILKRYNFGAIDNFW